MANTRIPITTSMSKSLKKARENANITQGALAKKASVPRARIKRIECMELTTIDQGEYARLSKAVGLAFKSAPKKATQVPAKSKAKLPKKASKPRKTAAKKPTRKALVKKLEEAGVLDLTLRQLLAS